MKRALLILCCLAAVTACVTPREEFYSNGQIKTAKLETPQLIQNYPCRGWVHYHPNGKLQQFELSQDAQLRELVWPKGSILLLDTHGRLRKAWPAGHITINGLPIASSSEIIFHGNGQIAKCTLQWDSTVQGVPCKGDAFSPAYFHSNGSLRSCIVSEDFRIEDKFYREGWRIHLQKSGLTYPHRTRREQKLLIK